MRIAIMALRARHFLLSADALGPAVAAPTERNREEPRGSAEWEVGADTHIGNAIAGANSDNSCLPNRA